MTDQHGSDAMAGSHGSTDHGETHGHDDHAHADAEAPLGPVDARAWGAALFGILLGFVVAGALALGSGFLRV